MNRRNVLFGLGAAAAGSGAVFGSGAFTQIDAQRSVNIVVEGDASAQLALNATSNTNIVDNDGDDNGNSLDIDTSNSGTGGLNADARVDIGNTAEQGTADITNGTNIDDNFDSNAGPAFKISSNASRSIDVLFDMTGINDSNNQELSLIVEDPTDGADSIAIADNLGSTNDKLLIESLSSDDTALNAAFVLNTADATDNLTGNITVTAEPKDNGTITEGTSLTGPDAVIDLADN